MANDDIQNLLRTAIQAAQGGNKAIARHILDQVIDQDPDNEMAWLWKASVAETTTERRDCLQRVVTINPDNERAARALEQLERVAPAPPPPRERPPSAATPRLGALEIEQAMPVHRTRDELSVDLEREALLAAIERRRRQRMPSLVVLIGVLAVAMIVVGLVLLWDYIATHKDGATPTPIPEAPAAAIPTVGTQAPAFVTPTPVGGVLITIPAMETLPGTWTPTATWTPSPLPAASATPVPLEDYTLLVSGKRDDEPEWLLYTMSAAGDAEERIPLQLAPAGDEAGGLTLIQAYDAAYSPDGQQIVFTGRVSQVQVQDAATVTVEFEELFIAPAAGGQIQRLTTLEADNAKGAFWSPDGEQIVFASDVDGDFDIYLVSVNGGQPWAITFNNADDRQPAWSPDGLTIAFASDQGGPGFLEVWSMTADSANLKQLTDDANNSYAPAWSPDGYYIAFVSDRRVDTDLYVMNADGTGERLLTLSDDRFEERDPAWSPDGSWIAFSSNRGGALFDLYLIRPDGSDLQQVTVDRGENRYVTWMP